MKKIKLTPKQQLKEKIKEQKDKLNLKKLREQETNRHLEHQSEIESLKFQTEFINVLIKNKKLRHLPDKSFTKTKKLNKSFLNKRITISHN